MPVKVLTVREPTEGAIAAYEVFKRACDDKTGLDDTNTWEVTDVYGKTTEYEAKNQEEFIELIEKTYPHYEFCGTLLLENDVAHLTYRLYLKPKPVWPSMVEDK